MKYDETTTGMIYEECEDLRDMLRTLRMLAGERADVDRLQDLTEEIMDHVIILQNTINYIEVKE